MPREDERNRQEREVLAAALDLLREMTRKVIAQQTVLDLLADPSWPRVLADVLAAQTPTIDAQLQPLIHAILGGSRSMSEDSLPSDWRETARKLIESASERPPE